MSNTTRHPQCHMRTSLGNCDPVGGFCTSVNESVCEALHKVSRPRIDIVFCRECKYQKDCERTLVLNSMYGEIGDYASLDFCSYGEREGE